MRTTPEIEPSISSTEQPLTLHITRLIRAPRERVFAAWTRPEQLRQWYAPGGLTVAELNVDATPGADFSVTMQGVPPSRQSTETVTVRAKGTYQQIVPPSLISFTWSGDWKPGEETTITIRLSEVEGGTLLDLTQETFTFPDSITGYSSGWNSSITKLETLLESE
jgi:uncharacterized protein YndB with AHSA1/START domain